MNPIIYINARTHDATKKVASFLGMTMSQFAEAALKEKMLNTATKDKIVKSIIDKLEVK